MQTLTERDYKKILICLTLYLTSLFAANTLGMKLMPFIFGTNLSVGVFCFPIVFIMTDMIGEIYGKKMAKNFVLAGVISIVLFLFYSLISTSMPWAEKGLWVKDSYNQVFGLSARISIASLTAFFIAEYQDVIAFFFFPKESFFSAKKIRTLLCAKYKVKNLGVIISDSGLVPFRSGVIGLAIGYAGFKGAKSYKGKKDIFGRKFMYQKVNVADSLATSAVLCMGEGSERQPLALITNAPVVFKNKINKKELIIDPKKDIYAPLFNKIN